MYVWYVRFKKPEVTEMLFLSALDLKSKSGQKMSTNCLMQLYDAQKSEMKENSQVKEKSH